MDASKNEQNDFTTSSYGKESTIKRFSLRKKWMQLWAFSALIVLAVGYLAGFLIRSPLDAAQGNSNVNLQATAQVAEHEFFPESVQAKGEIRKGRSIVIPEFSLASGELPVITEQIVKTGDVTQSGKSVFYVAGQPVFVLHLPFALYRDLKPGDSGHDVEALQRELSRLGHYRGVIDGQYGAGMAAAVRSLYASIGAEPPQAPAELRDAVKQAQEAYNATFSGRSTVQGTRSTEEEPDTLDRSELRKELTKAQVLADTPLYKFAIISVPVKKVDVVKSPKVGTVMSENPDALQLRSKGTTVTGRFTVLEKESFEVGSKVIVTVQTDTNTTGAGEVLEITDFRDANDEDGLPPGYDYVIKIEKKSEENFSDKQKVIIAGNTHDTVGKTAVAVPLLAIRQDDKGEYVYTIANPSTAAEPDTYKRIDITLGQQQDGWVDISGTELAVGTHVVLGGGQ